MLAPGRRNCSTTRPGPHHGSAGNVAASNLTPRNRFGTGRSHRSEASDSTSCGFGTSSLAYRPRRTAHQASRGFGMRYPTPRTLNRIAESARALTGATP